MQNVAVLKPGVTTRTINNRTLTLRLEFETAGSGPGSRFTGKLVVAAPPADGSVVALPLPLSLELLLLGRTKSRKYLRNVAELSGEAPPSKLVNSLGLELNV